MINNSVPERLVAWYQRHKREMPWRGELDPYRIWLSEIILQQTRVEQGLPYYQKFLRLFPTVKDLAEANQDAVLKAWEGLGYYSRARNLHKAAQRVQHEMDGVFPDSYNGLLQLSGVGPYTAAAIASICYNESVAVVDGNVNRFISRLYCIEEEVDSSVGKKLITASANALISQIESAGEFNQALMEFGSLHCVPRNPDCASCPFNEDCLALRKGMVNLLPNKKAKQKVKHRYFDYHVILDGEHTFIQQRGEGDIWSGLYEFILEETGADRIDTALLKPKILAQAEFKHILSHQHIHARFLVYAAQETEIDSSWIKIPVKDLRSLPFSRLSTRFLEAGFLSDESLKG